MSSSRFSYGGQAVLEGVMIRGRQFFSVSVRRPDGEICSVTHPVHTFYSGTLRRIPLVRGVVVLLETLVLGMRSLSYSANVALEQEGKELGRRSIALMLGISLAFGIGVFFVAPLFLARSLDDILSSDVLSNLLEGVIRLAIFLGYLVLIGRMPDIRRVFAYHGAEHMAVHTYEQRQPLEVEAVRKYSTAHPRCGTAFLLVVLVVAIVVFVFLGRPDLPLLILSRIVLIPVIAGISYEVIRFSGAHAGNPVVRLVTVPSLALQALTTRVPDDAQIEVAIHAMKRAMAADERDVAEPGSGEAEASAQPDARDMSEA